MLVLDCLPRAVIVIDTDGTIVGWNAVSARFYGWTAEQAVGQSMYDLITPPPLVDAGRMIARQVMASGVPWSGDVNVLLHDGQVVRTFSFLGPVRDADGAIVGLLAAADDEAQLRQLADQTSQLTDRLLLALSAGRLGTWQWHMPTGIITWDPLMEELWGFAPGTFGGTYDEYVNALHPEERDAVLQTVHEAVANKSEYEVEHRVTLADGTTRWLHGRGKVTLDHEGNVTGTIGCSTDVTERKLAETNNVRRLREAEQAASRERLQRERLEFLTRLNDQALHAPDEAALMKAVASTAVPELGDWCLVYFLPEPGVTPVIEVGHADPTRVDWARQMLAQFPYDPAALTGVPVVIRDGRTEFIPSVDTQRLHRQIDLSGQRDLDVLHQIADTLALTSMITVPLVTRRGVVGAIQFVSAESGRRYDQDDVALAEAAAGRVAEALVNSWLTSQQRLIASTLQAALLPPALPAIPGVTVAVRYWAAGAVTDVGGDFYDVFPIDGDTWAIVIGDVCGTGPRAAAVTSIARHTIRAAATHGANHHQVMEWVNDAIVRSNKNTFCTVVYSTLRRDADGGWQYTCALGGHPRPVVVPFGRPSRAIGSHGTLIGVLPTIDSPTQTVQLNAGDAMVLYTDGVTDLRPPNNLDEDELVALVEGARDNGDADVVAGRLGSAIQALVPIVDRHDDVALLVISIDP
jgi:PAS domain S-box-containing protein